MYPFIPVSYALSPLESLVNPAEAFIKKIKSMPPGLQKKELRDLEDWRIVEPLEYIEKLDKSLRSALSSEFFDDVKLLGNLQKLWTDVSVYEYPGLLFVLYLPPLVGCSYRTGEYGISRRVQAELHTWFKAHEAPVAKTGLPLVFAYRRFILAGDKGACDNDNMEMRRITNAVVGAMGRSDQPTRVSFMYSTCVSDFRGVELAVFSKDKLPELTDKLNGDAPFIRPNMS